MSTYASDVVAAIGRGSLTGLEWAAGVFRFLKPCVVCRTPTKAGANWQGRRKRVRLCGTCWRGAGGIGL